MRSSFRLPVWLLPLIPVLLPGAALIAGHNYSENAAATTVQIGACASRTGAIVAAIGMARNKYGDTRLASVDDRSLAGDTVLVRQGVEVDRALGRVTIPPSGVAGVRISENTTLNPAHANIRVIIRTRAGALVCEAWFEP
jgi:hypothetical protein